MKGIINRLLQFINPTPCPVCGLRIDESSQIVCTICDMQIPRTGYAADPYENQMAKLYWGRIPIEKAAAFMFYHARTAICNIVYDMKYHDQSELCYKIGKEIAIEFSRFHFFDDIDIILPIPLSKSRIKERGYNQSVELAKGLSKITLLPIATNAIKRTTFSKSQTRLNRFERLENMQGVWELISDTEIKGKHILLVDDVVTTGATTISCAKELLKVGDIKLSILSLAYAKH